MHRAVVHVPDGANVVRAIKNVRNLLADFEDGIEVVLVLNGDAVESLVPASPQAPGIAELAARNVGIRACARALRNHGIDAGALVPGVEVVPGGVSEVVRLECLGYAYLRP